MNGSGDDNRSNFKRGVEEVFGGGQLAMNGGSCDTIADNPDTLIDVKKVKLDTDECESRVVHLRSLPMDINELEIVNVGIPFGKVTNVLLIKQKNQAFLEFSEPSQAAKMNSHYASYPCSMRGRTIHIQLSNHKELKTDSAAYSQQNANARAAIQAIQSSLSSDDANKTILHVTVENCLYPITVDIFEWVFSKYGKILKIITFKKDSHEQALIQYSEPSSARTAKMSLEGQCIYNGCCTLRIDYSKLSSLQVKYNNSKSRDFTNPNLPSGDMGGGYDSSPQFGGGHSQQGLLSQSLTGVSGIPGLLSGFGQGHSNNPSMSFGGFPSGLLHSLRSSFKNDNFNDYEGGNFMGKGSLLGGSMGFNMGNPLAAAAQMAMSGMGGPQGTCVVHVSNLDESMVTVDALFTLFGVYGNVLRVKILYNKKDCALIQMADPDQAQRAIHLLDNVRLWGKPLRVSSSKHTHVQLPKEGQQDNGLTKDFTNSNQHRFKHSNARNFQNIFAPSAVLHLSNIPEEITEDDLHQLFSQHGSVTGFKFFTNDQRRDHRMALIQMGSVEEGIVALMAVHNTKIGDKQYLRVSFSRSKI